MGVWVGDPLPECANHVARENLGAKGFPSCYRLGAFHRCEVGDIGLEREVFVRIVRHERTKIPDFIRL